MKVSKVALSTARRIFRLCTVNGAIDDERMRKAINLLATKKPRDYRAIMHVLRRLIKTEIQSKAVTVESAKQLDPQTAERLSHSLRRQYGEDLTFTFRANPELIGGLRVRVGNDVYDGSIKARLARLAQAF